MICSRCKKEKMIDQMCKSKDVRGWSQPCKDCKSEANLRYRQQHKYKKPVVHEDPLYWLAGYKIK